MAREKPTSSSEANMKGSLGGKEEKGQQQNHSNKKINE